VTPALRATDAALQDIDKLRKFLARGHSKQVHSDDERQITKATANTWFHTHRASVVTAIGQQPVEHLDATYKSLIACTGRATLRSRYLRLARDVSLALGKLHAQHVLELSQAPDLSIPARERPPEFDPLVPDPKMRGILVRRWTECVATIRAGAPLSATVMMGGLLEAILLARLNKMPDKGPALRSQAAPKDSKTGTVIDIRSWTLKDYIGIAHELQWISTSAKDVSVVLRDYRNYIHPQKEYSHGIILTPEDATILWTVATGIIRQVLASVI
jgi:hypothetical protein